MIGSLAWRALMRRNLIYRRRDWISSILEMALPICFVGILVSIKNAVGDVEGDVIPAIIPDDRATLRPITFSDYMTALQAERTCVDVSGGSNDDFWITGIPNQGRDWPVPFVKCDSYLCEFDGEDAQKYCEYGIIGLAPTDVADAGGLERANDFRDWLIERYPAIADGSMPFGFDMVRVFDSNKEMEQYVKAGKYGDEGFPKIVMGVVFEGNDPNNFVYTLRQNSTNFNAPEEAARPTARTTPDTAQTFDSFAKNDFSVCDDDDGTPYLGRLGFSCTGQYFYNGVLPFQRLVNDFIMNVTGAAANGYYVAEDGMRFIPFPSPSYQDSGFFEDAAVFLPLILVLGLLYPIASMIQPIVREKQLRQKELMKMMSVRESDIGWAWFCSFFWFHMITATLCAAVSTSLYTNSEFIYLLIFWVLAFISFICFSMTIATLTSKQTRGVLIGLLVFFGGVFLTLSVAYDTGSEGTIGMISLHPVAAFSYGLSEIGNTEEQGIGLTGNSIGNTDNASGYTFATCIRDLIFDCVLWGLLSAYLNRVIKPDYGQAQSVWFPCQALYRMIFRPQPVEFEEFDKMEGDDGIPNEPVSDTLKRQSEAGENIEIRGLTKTFGDKTAVENLSLTMYRGQITALLGHNGAGKTTTINMLTGAMAPTDGTAKVAGKDIRNQMQDIRGSIGICLQHDCLFPWLTVREHVQFFSRLKGLYTKMSREEADEHVDQVIRDVALYEKRNTFSKNLSGGMKRKLSVAMAFCGDSKVVLLDEPTSGMDPFSRRFTWNVIRQMRQGRVIILTTHFMDEADILGDRIAIMSEGRLRCSGSPLFLKKTYGVGYQLTIEKRSAQKDKSLDQATVDDNLKGIVHDAVPEASLLNNVGTELSFQLPIGAASNFSTMFEGLDDQIEKNNIITYGVSITTLDEVFLLVARGDSDKKEQFASSKHVTSSAARLDDEASGEKSARSRMNLEQDNLFGTHLRALFRKRVANFRRDKKAWICTSVVPGIFVFIGLLLYTFVTPARNLEALPLNAEMFNPNFESSIRNPVPVNTQDSVYACQPGQCAFPFSDFAFAGVSLVGSGENYTFCATNLQLDGSCSISESELILANLGDAGTPVFIDASTPQESSAGVFSSRESFASSQYGAIFFTRESSSVLNSTAADAAGALFSDTIAAACLANDESYREAGYCDRFGGYGYLIQYNFTAVHGTPIFVSIADQSLIRESLGSNDFNIQASVHPLPITTLEEGFGEAEDAFSAWFLIVLSFPFIAGAFAVFVIDERQSKAKHLQTVAGVKPAAYWVSTFLWDIMNYQIPMWISVILFFAFGVDILTTRDRGVLSGVLAIIFLYGPASASFAYCISFAFTSSSLCNVVIIISGFIIGLGGPLTNFILILLGSDPGNPRDNLINAAKILTWVLRFFPSFNLGKGIFNAINIETFDYLEGKRITAWSEPILLIEVIFLAVEAVVYLLLAMLLDRWSSNPRIVNMWRMLLKTVTCRCCCPNTIPSGSDITTALPDDDDVIAEQDRVLGGEANSDLIVLSQLTKMYDNGKLAVNNLSFGIPPGQCFGLLGINGAGKTTTMQMLTAEFPPSSGDASLAGYSVSNEPEKTRRRVGYCPQFDAHFPNMTGREHVELYASIKGIPKEFIKEAAAAKLQEVGLSDADSDRLSSGYSGGMKRRLSLACAMIGQPQIVFLDECSTGVDPVARREIWQLVSDMVIGENVAEEEKTSVILTTHSMEECEALCPRIGIMANGRLRCLGSAQHLKDKFGQGYQVELKSTSVKETDVDFATVRSKLAAAKGFSGDEEADTWKETTYSSVAEVISALNAVDPEGKLAGMIDEHSPHGYLIYKNASAGIVTIEEVASFATSETRVQNMEKFITDSYPNSVLRERQDNKIRYEVSSQGLRISELFAAIEGNKERLMIGDYGVSQTSLEQVFNMHAAEAEKLKQGRDDK